MPTDRSNNANSGRPLMPTLATTRTAKTPITPRLAPSIASASSSQSGRPIRSTTATAPRLATASRDEVSTPVKALLNSNITPRSSSRKSRAGAGSATSTPGATPCTTPIASRPTSTIDVPPRDLGFNLNNGSGRGNPSRPRSIVGGSSSGSTTGLRMGNAYNHSGTEVGGGSSMFFHALDAKGQEQGTTSKKSPTFFYANGQQDTASRPQEIPSPPLSSIGRPSSDVKFFHADSIPDAKGNATILTPPVSKSPELLPSQSSTHHYLRPPSPSKENIHLSYRKGASQVIRPNLHVRSSPLVPLSSQSNLSSGQTPARSIDPERASRRQSSATMSTVRLSHRKSTSMSSIDSASSLKKVPSHQNEMSFMAPSPLQREKRVVSNASSVPESIASEPPPATDSLPQLPPSSPPSPTRSVLAQGSLQQMNELAANARRERKVLDLEISNSSLLAINRQLEREVRKQKAELRRYRRMTRGAVFPASSSIAVSGEFSTTGDISDIDDESAQEEEEQDESLEESENDSSISSGNISPSALADRSLSYRLKDEKRLQLDLSKHREILVDSQKMNQSIKRCLNWTEELIRDAKRALEYKVPVSEVQLGGRVLDQEEIEDEEEEEVAERRGLLSPWTPAHHYDTVNPFERPEVGGEERTDKDSGVDVDGLGPLIQEVDALLLDAGPFISRETLARLRGDTDVDADIGGESY